MLASGLSVVVSVIIRFPVNAGEVCTGICGLNWPSFSITCCQMAAFWIALLLLGVVALCRADILVNTSLGTVKGVQTPKGQSFLGLPFARPPIGDLRWQPPLPPHSWVGVREANLFGADCAAGYCIFQIYICSGCFYLQLFCFFVFTVFSF